MAFNCQQLLAVLRAAGQWHNGSLMRNFVVNFKKAADGIENTTCLLFIIKSRSSYAFLGISYTAMVHQKYYFSNLLEEYVLFMILV